MRTVPEKVLEEEQQTAPDARPHAGTAGHTQHTCHRLAPLPSKAELRGLLDFCKSVKILLPRPCLRQEHGSGVEGVLWEPGGLTVSHSFPIINSKGDRGRTSLTKRQEACVPKACCLQSRFTGIIWCPREHRMLQKTQGTAAPSSQKWDSFSEKLTVF